MKTNLLILAFVLCAGVMAVHAQAPSQQPPPRDTTSVQPSESYLKGMTMIKSSDVPSSLRTTLEAQEYTGWENVPIYRNEGNDMYIIEMRDKDQKLVPYRFDATGKVIKDN